MTNQIQINNIKTYLVDAYDIKELLDDPRYFQETIWTILEHNVEYVNDKMVLETIEKLKEIL